MSFGDRLRELRQDKSLTLRDLAAKVGVGFTYLSKIENERLPIGHSPSEQLIHKLAESLDADENELVLLADKVPEPIRRRVYEQPEIFMALAELDDADLEAVFRKLGSRTRKG
jgi:transcriptional regulator with XRE-family HTH domain